MNEQPPQNPLERLTETFKRFIGKLPLTGSTIVEVLPEYEAYDPVSAGFAFGKKELDRIERERKDIPGVARAFDLGGSGVGLGEYGQSVLNAPNPLNALHGSDRQTYGPPETKT